MKNIVLDALSNTLLGMGTVFAVLIIIIFVIIAMTKVVSVIEGAKKKNTVAPAAPAPAPAPVQETVVEEEEVDDLELVAVITAAIAATMGTSTDGFVVRSIKRAPKRNW